jgi:hypothetical protein
MAQIDTDLYMNIAYNYHLAKESMLAVSAFLEDALHEVVDVTTTAYSGGQAAATEIELLLLRPLNTAFSSIDSIMNSDAALLEAVRTVNNHVTLNDPNGSIAAFLNTCDFTAITGESCTPYYWCDLSTSAGYNTVGWGCCNIS